MGWKFSNNDVHRPLTERNDAIGHALDQILPLLLAKRRQNITKKRNNNGFSNLFPKWQNKR